MRSRNRCGARLSSRAGRGVHGLRRLLVLLAATCASAAVATPSASAASSASAVTATPVAAGGAGVANPYREITLGHPYRHGVVPSLTWLRSHSIPTNQASGGGNLSYGGGLDGVGVTTGRPEIYLVFWGGWGSESTDAQGYTTFSNDPAGVAPYLQAFFKGLGTGGETWSGVMTQYCEGVAAGSQTCPADSSRVGYPFGGALAGVWYDTNPEPLAASANELAQQAVFAAEHFGNTTTAANRSVQYDIVSATGLDPDNYVSGGFCAWHDYTGDPTLDGGGAVSTPWGTPVAFTNMPYIPDAGKACGANYVNHSPSGNLDGVSIVGGHEWAETLTDQFPPGGWIDSTGLETGDKCAWIPPGSGQGASADITLTTGTFAVQSTWANDFANGAGGCEISHPIDSTVTRISPSSGPTSGGTVVTITGSNLLGATAVDFGSNAATSVTCSATSCSATSPPRSAGAVDVTVKTPEGTSAISAADRFDFAAAPVVSTTSPDRGPTSGGTLVTITGKYLTGATAVHFGTKLAKIDKRVSSTEIKATAPKGSGTVYVTVTTAGGTSAKVSADRFSYVLRPVVTKLSRTRGPTSGGTLVTITGKNLAGATAVHFGAKLAKIDKRVSSTEIDVTAPKGSGTVYVKVTTAGGTSAKVSAARFSYV